MRLWHKDLINVLPRQQLLAQWRELSAIVGAIQKHGTPNHLLVNKITDYNKGHFWRYSYLIMDEMVKRGYIISDAVVKKIQNYCGSPVNFITKKMLYQDWHNNEYFKICYYNLYEKYLCGGITEEEWKIIAEKAIKEIILGEE